MARWFKFLGQSPEEELLQAAYRYAVSLSREPSRAEDLVQEASLKLCRKYGRIKSQGLLFTTIRHLFYDECRREKIVTFSPLEESIEEVESSKETLQLLDSIDLETIMEQLSPNERELLYFNEVEGFSAQEISGLTGQPRGTILWTLAQTKKKLRAFCEEENKRVREGNQSGTDKAS